MEKRFADRLSGGKPSGNRQQQTLLFSRRRQRRGFFRYTLIIACSTPLRKLAGAAKSLGDGIYALVPSKTAVTSALLLLTLASYGWDFTEAVNLFYPFIAAIASGVFALAFAALAVYALSRRIKRFSYARKKE